MHRNMTPRLPGIGSQFFSFVRSLVAGNNIAVVNQGNGIWQVSYVPKAPALLSINQDYQEYGPASASGQFATYSHGKASNSDGDSFYYEVCGYSDDVGQQLEFQLDFQSLGTFTTQAVGGWKLWVGVHIRDAGTNDHRVTSLMTGCGIVESYTFSNSLGNSLTLDYGGGKTLDPYFNSGPGNAYAVSFDAWYKPAGSV